MSLTTPLAAQIVWPDEGARTWKPRPTEAAITANDLRTRLYQLADDSMKGREVGTLGNVMATNYIAAEFKRIQPKQTIFTYFHLAAVPDEPGRARHRCRHQVEQ